MPTAELSGAGQEPAEVRYLVRTSLAVEIMWALSGCRQDPGADAAFPARRDRFSAAPELPGRVAGFWGDGSDDWAEVLVLAHRRGADFEMDWSVLRSRLAEAAAAPAEGEPLESETEEARGRILGHIESLCRAPELREAWLKLLSDVWEAIRPAWETEGRAIAEAAARSAAARLAGASRYADLLPLVGGDWGGLLGRLVHSAAERGWPVAVIPAWLGRRGFVLSLPGLLAVGPLSQPAVGGPSEETRERARRLKALGDPTRLAILEAVAVRPATVGELARALGLAQPTVSKHVGLLREAGLVRDRALGGRRRLEVDAAALERLFEELRRAVGPAG